MPAPDDAPMLEYASPTPRSGRRLWPILLLGVVALVWMLTVSVMMPSPNRSRVEGTRFRSASNLRQIGQAIVLYCNDNAGAFPDSFRTLYLNGDITGDVYISPESSDTPAAGPTTQAIADQLDAGGHLSYIYLGRGLTTKTVTENTIVAYEKLSIFGTGANVLFGDGHVEFNDASFATEIIDQSASGRFPVTMPTQ